jgi:hypothetical protein
MRMSEFSKWMNAIADAYNRGEADWAYPDGTSEAVRFWNSARERYSEAQSDELLVTWAQQHGISLKRRKPV